MISTLIAAGLFPRAFCARYGFSAARNANSIAWVEIDGSTTLAQREQALQFFKNYASTSMRVAKDEAVAAQLVSLSAKGVFLVSQVWFITGSARGLERKFASAALEAGHKVAATARKVSDLRELQQKYGNQVLPLALDVTNEVEALRAVHSCVDVFGRLDVLINNAGYGNVAPIEDTSVEEFRKQIETNLFGTIIVTKACLPYFREQRSGHFVQITSIAGRIGPIGRAPYAAAKWEWRVSPKRWRRKWHLSG